MQQHLRCNSTKSMPKDPKQMLITELNRQDREESSRIDIIAGRPIDQRLGASDVYVILDSSQRNIFSSDPSNGLFVFDIRSGGITGDGMIGVSTELNDITEIECQSWPLPDLPLYVLPTNPTAGIVDNSLPTLVANNPSSGQPSGSIQMNQLFSNRFIMEIKETSMQSFSDVGGVRHNFAFDVVVAGIVANQQVYASPVSPVYVFTDPITRFDRLSLVFRNPPRPLQFANDILSNTRLAIIPPTAASPNDWKFINKGKVKVVVSIDISGFNAYAYNAGAKTITFNCDVSAVTAFIDPTEASHLFVVQTGAINNKVQIDLGQNILFTNTEGDGENVANGMYSLTSIAASATFTTVFTRATALDDPSKCVKFSALEITSGLSLGQKFMLMSATVTNFASSVQNWKDYRSVMFLSLYYPNHQLLEDNRITITNLNPRTLPQKIYNYLVRKEGLYIGATANNTDDYVRLNPDVSMSEFIYTSMTNNYITKNAQEAKLYGFDTLKGNQIVIVPSDFTKTITQLKNASGCLGFETPPVTNLYGLSNIIDDVTYKSLSTYNTAAILDKVYTDTQYIELQYTGVESTLTDLHLGILSQFSNVDFTTPVIASQTGVVSVAGDAQPNIGWNNTNITFGKILLDNNIYKLDAGSSYNTAVVVNKDISDGDFIVLEYTNGAGTAPTQHLGVLIGTITQTTYEAIGANANWASTYVEVSANDNILFGLTANNILTFSKDGDAAATVALDPVISTMDNGSKIYLAAAKLTSTKISVTGIWKKSDGTIAYAVNFTITVANADTWFTDRRFYVTSHSDTQTFRILYEDKLPTVDYSLFDGPNPAVETTFYTPYLSKSIPLTTTESSWSTPAEYTYGSASIVTYKGGSGYVSESIESSDPLIPAVIKPTVTVTGGGGVDFKGTVDVVGGIITKINVTAGGSGFSSVPTVVITGTHDVKAEAEAIISGGAITAINLKSQHLYSTKSNNYNTASIIDTNILTGNYAVFEYTGNTTKVLNLHFGIIDKKAYQSMRLDMSLPKSANDDWTILRNITLNEGVLLNLNLNSLYGNVLVSLLASPDSWDYPTEYSQGVKFAVVDGIYTPTTNQYTTASIILKEAEDGKEQSITYLGDIFKYPSLRYGMVSSENFNDYLRFGPLTVIPNLGWATPSDFTFGNAGDNDGIYVPELQYNTAVGIKDDKEADVDVTIKYIASAAAQLHGVFGIVDKSAYENIKLISADSTVPFTIGKDIWNLPAPYAFLSSNTKNGIYRTNTSRYNTAAIVDYDIRDTPMTFQYTAKTAKHLPSYYGYIDKTVYESLTGVADNNNWAISPELTSNDGVLIRVIYPPIPSDLSINLPLKLPSTAGWVLSTNNSGIYSFGSANETDGKYSTNTTTYNTAAIIDREPIGICIFKYVGDLSLDLSAYFGFISKFQYGVFTGAQSDATNWASSIQIVDGGPSGILFKVLSPLDPENIFTPNSALQYLNRLQKTIIDLETVIPPIGNGGQIQLTKTITDAPLLISNNKWTTPLGIDYGESNITDNIYHTDSSLFNTAAILIGSISVNPSVAYKYKSDIKSMSSAYAGFVNKSTYEGLTLPGAADDLVNWTIAKQITEDEGVIVRYLSPNHPDNTKNTGRGCILEPVIEDGVIKSINIISAGSKYPTSGPPIYIRGIASATATAVDGVIDALIVKNGGSGYDPETTSISISGGPGTGFVGTLVIIGGVILSVNINSHGSSYGTPVVTITDTSGNGSGADIEAVAIDGVINSVTVTNEGSDYSISDPPTINVGFATFEYSKKGDVLTQLSSFTSGPELQDNDIFEIGVDIFDPTTITLVLQLNDGEYKLLITNFITITVTDSTAWINDYYPYITNNNTNVNYGISTNEVQYQFTLVQSDGILLVDKTVNVLESYATLDYSDNVKNIRPYVTTNSSSEKYWTTVSTTNTVVEYTIDGTKTYSDVGKAIDKVKEGGRIGLQYKTAATSVDINFMLFQDNGDTLINDIKTINVTDGTAWHTNKKAYITTNSKSDRYVSDPNNTGPNNWAINGNISREYGVFVKWISPTDPGNPYAPNSAVRKYVNGIPTTTNVDSVLADIAQNGYVKISSTVTDYKTVTATFKLHQSTDALLDTVTIPIVVTALPSEPDPTGLPPELWYSTHWIKDKMAYLSTMYTGATPETYQSTISDPNNWASDVGIAKDGFMFQILSPDDPLNSGGGNAELMFTAGTTVVKSAFTFTFVLKKEARMIVKVTVNDGTHITVGRSIIQDDGTVLLSNVDTQITVTDTVDWHKKFRMYVTGNDPTESYTTGQNCLINQIYNGSVSSFESTDIKVLKKSDQYSTVVMSVDTASSTELKVDFTFFDSAGVSLAQQQLTLDVAKSSDWYTDKRFYLTTNDPTETYSTDVKLLGYTPSPSTNGPHLQIDSNIISVTNIDTLPDTDPTGVYVPGTLTRENWTNNIRLTKREGFLINIDYTNGSGIALENGNIVSMTTVTNIAGKKIDTDGYIQIGVLVSGNNVVYNILIFKSVGTKIGEYSKTFALSNGTAWKDDTTKRWYATTNNPLHTFRVPEIVHAWRGTVLGLTDYIDTGLTGYSNYITDFTNIVDGRSFTVGLSPLHFLNGRNRVTSITNSIISLTGQDNALLNKFYQLETTDDIKTTGIRLSENNLIMPLSTMTVTIPSRQFKIPFRFRRLLRRVTQMSGI